MPKPHGLIKRRGSSKWQLRQRRPAHLMRPGLRPHEMISLGTADYREAVAKLPEARAILAARFRDAFLPTATDMSTATGIVSRTVRRQRPEGLHLPILTMEDAARLARWFVDRELEQLDLAPLFRRSLPDLDAQRIEQELEDRIAALSYPNEDVEDEHPSLSVEVGLLAEHGFRSQYDSRASVLLREHLRRGMLSIAKIELARFNGDYSVDVVDPLFLSRRLDEPAPGRSGHAGFSHGPTVKQASDIFLVELLKKSRKVKTQDRYTREVRHIVAFLGADTALGSLRRQHSVDFRDTFELLPPNFMRAVADGISLQEVVRRRRDNDPKLSWETHEKYLSMFRRFVKWADKEDYLPKNYADDLKPLGTKPDGSMAKFPFEDAELRKIFNRPIYTGCRDDTYGFSQPGPNIIRRSRYWAPLIALLSGLRAGEILQLTPDHVRVSDNGTYFIVLTPDMELKTESAQREIPIHPILAQAGFMSWVGRRRDKPTSLLFPEVPTDKYNAGSPTFSKRFRSDLKHFNLGDRRPKLTFHSFRHTFKRALDDADVPEQHKDELCGWTRGTSTGRRYGKGLVADVLRPHVESVEYGVDFAPLVAHAAFED